MKILIAMVMLFVMACVFIVALVPPASAGYVFIGLVCGCLIGLVSCMIAG